MAAGEQETLEIVQEAQLSGRLHNELSVNLDLCTTVKDWLPWEDRGKEVRVRLSEMGKPGLSNRDALYGLKAEVAMMAAQLQDKMMIIKDVPQGLTIYAPDESTFPKVETRKYLDGHGYVTTYADHQCTLRRSPQLLPIDMLIRDQCHTLPIW